MTEKQKLFCDEYLKNGFNATQAYLKVYENVKSSKVANACAAKLLKIASIKAYIQKRIDEIHNENTAGIAEIMERLTAIGRGKTKDQIASFNGDILEIRTPTKDQIKALELLGKAHGMFDKNVNLNVDIPVFSGESDLED